MALEMQRLGALGLEKRVGKSILGKVPDMPGSEPSLSKPGAPAFPSPTGGPGARGAASASRHPGRHLLCAAGAPGHGALPRGGALLREGRGLGPRICHVPPAARGRPGRAGGHRGPGAHVLAAAASHPARHLSAGERAGVPEARAPRQPHPIPEARAPRQPPPRPGGPRGAGGERGPGQGRGCVGTPREGWSGRAGEGPRAPPAPWGSREAPPCMRVAPAELPVLPTSWPGLQRAGRLGAAGLRPPALLVGPVGGGIRPGGGVKPCKVLRLFTFPSE